MATFTVSNLNDSGAGSLRQAIADANAAAGTDNINFSGVTGTILLTTGQLAISDSVTITGPGSSSISVSGNNSSRVFDLFSNSATIDVSISGLTITGGQANDGAGIRNRDENLTLDSVVITGNTASDDGGGLWADGFDMNLTIRNSNISGNTSGDDGGGIYVEDTGGPLLIENSTISNNIAADDGGGIYFYDPDNDVTIRNSTISGNQAGDRGGGIYLYDTDGGVFTIENTTISANSAGEGGGIFFYEPDDPLVIRNSTITGNQATNGNGGGIYLYDLSSNSILSSNIIANNTATGVGQDLFVKNGDFTTVTNNLFETAPVGSLSAPNPATNVIGVDPLLGPLANNGGLTQTHALLAGSPAIDKGLANGLTTDQRGTGFLRVAGASADIGAFEVQAVVATTPTLLPDLTISKTVSSQIITGGQAITYAITVSNIGGSSASNITVSDSLPVGLTFFTATATGGFSTPSSTDTNGNLLFTGGSLAPGASATLTVVVTAPNNISATGYTNIATVDPLNLIVESNENNNSASARVGVIPEAAPPPIGEPLPPIINISPPAPIPRGFIDKEILPDYPPGTFITPELQNPLLGVNILGGNGNDTLRGGAGNDTIRGGQGDDTIYGYGGNNLLIGGKGNDVLYGGKGNDTLIGTNTDSAGKGEIDILIGGKGSNLFILGDEKNAYYNDGINSSPGLEDYALITDFNLNEDAIQLKKGVDYFISTSPPSLPSGAAIFIDNDGIAGLSSNDELIAILQGVPPDNVGVISARFQFV